jgi:Gpi18-like mannosyltransferase
MASTLRLVLPPFVAGKLVTLGVPMLTVWSSSPGPVSYSDLMRPFGSWDAATYTQIAAGGYPSGPLDVTPGHPGHLWGFFPGVPMLVRVAHVVIPDYVTAGVVVNAVAELIALWFLARLVLLERGGDEESARFSVWMLALYPYAVFLTAVYTEAPFLAAATASLYYMRRGSNLPACGAAAVAMAMRISGVALIPALLIEYLRRRGWRPGFGLLPIALSVLPIVGFGLYAHYATGDALAYQHIQQSASYGSRTNTWPWTALWNTWQIAARGSGGSSYIFTMEVLFGLAALVALVVMAVQWRRFPPALTAFAAVVWLLPATLTYWLGMPRYEMTMVPFFILAADLTRRRPVLRMPVLVVSCGWMAFVASMLASGRYTG